jgi:hypothetical protein
MTGTATVPVTGPAAIVRHRVAQPTTSEPNRASAILRAPVTLCSKSMIPKSGYRFSEKIMLQEVSSRRVNQ